MKERRMAKAKDKKKNEKSALNDNFITVQRLSAEVSGKAQKYARIGARVFVPFEFDDLTIANIKAACLKHFAVDPAMTCDVVAGEQGPSCRSFKQVPDSKVIHVRFIEETNVEILDESTATAGAKSPPSKKRCSTFKSAAAIRQKSQPMKKTCSPSKFVPRSLSLVEMLKLGRKIDQTTTKIDIYSFNLDSMTWSSTPRPIDFVVDQEPFGVGGFRQAFKATSSAAEFSKVTWVVKRYLERAVEDIAATKQTVEQHTKKVVQMHYLSRNFAARLHQELEQRNQLECFGETLKYNKVFLGKIDSEYVTVEEYAPGPFTKYINNTGNICGDTASFLCQKAECLAHYSYERSNAELMVLDIQGCNYILFDPEVASKKIQEGEEYLFCTGNLSAGAISMFTSEHKCRIYCELLNLPDAKKKD